MDINNKLDELKKQLTELLKQRKELSEKFDNLTTLGVKIEGAIEVLEQLNENDDKKEDEND